MNALLTSNLMLTLPWLLAAVAVVIALFKHQSAKVATAQLATVKAETTDSRHQTDDARAEAQASTEALDKVQAAGVQRVQIDAAVAAAPEGEARKELQNEYGRD